jgi:hypothetical protein
MQIMRKEAKRWQCCLLAPDRVGLIQAIFREFNETL